MKLPRSFPPDVLVIDTGSVIHARIGRGQPRARVDTARSYPLPPGTLSVTSGVPLLENPEAFSAVLRQIRLQNGGVEKATLLLPDPWFRLAILELGAAPGRGSEVENVIRWALRRNLPINPDEYRIAWQPVGQTSENRVLVAAAFETWLASIEAACREASVTPVVVEPIGLSLWNAVVSGEATTNAERLFLFVRGEDFTTGLFRGITPVFIRSRSLGPDRSLEQELRLSASYVRTTLGSSSVSLCWVAGNGVRSSILDLVKEEFGAEVRRIALDTYADTVDMNKHSTIEAELVACMGVFTV